MKILRNPIFFIFFTLCAIVFSLSMLQSRNSNQLKADLNELERQNVALGKRKEALEFEARMSEKKITQEKVIRDQLWKQKAGEVVLELKDFETFKKMWVAKKELATQNKNGDDGEENGEEKLLSQLNKNPNWQAWWVVLKKQEVIL